ncbi:hypothetical protein QTA57_08220 [Fontisubflavum oceani]|uniref:hypothetical protein n=1 Tax=Fontisubflavum oceani TaxID=2978973 RepID=UPI0025B33A4D|nr:hypothetical protein [Fontisubflavum oceani]WJY23047.1 hypothetical protein QTA57_08220 [Fontisubflavum oceani]
MQNNTQSFRALLETDAALAATFDTISAEYIEEAQAAGISITKDDLCEITAVRLHALTGEKSGDWKQEAHAKLPAFQKAEAERMAFQAIMDNQHERHDAENERLAAMKPDARITHARAMGATSGLKKEARLSAT